MPFRRTSISILFLTTILSLTSACSASAQMSCSDVKYGNPRYHENMDELAKRAGLPDNYWSRYDEDVGRLLGGGYWGQSTQSPFFENAYLLTRSQRINRFHKHGLYLFPNTRVTFRTPSASILRAKRQAHALTLGETVKCLTQALRTLTSSS